MKNINCYPASCTVNRSACAGRRGARGQARLGRQGPHPPMTGSAWRGLDTSQDTTCMPSALQLCNGLQVSVCFRMFAAVVIWNSRAGKQVVFNLPQPGRAAQF